MRKVTLFILFLINASFIHCQIEVGQIKETLSKIHDMQRSISVYTYKCSKEVRYVDNNYFYTSESDLYIEKDNSKYLGYRFQGRKNNLLCIYKEDSMYSIDTSAKTYKLEKIKNAGSLSGNSFLNYSMEMISSFIPKLLKIDSISYQKGDTIINGKKHKYISFQKSNYFYDGNLGFTLHDIKDLAHKHFILYDSSTFQITGFIMQYKRGQDNRDYYRNIFEGLVQNPTKPIFWTQSEIESIYQLEVEESLIPKIKSGSQLPMFKLPRYLPELHDTVSLDDFRGDVVFIEFWFKSCGPCMQAMPHLNEIQAKYENKQFKMISINVEDPVSDLAFFYNKHKPTFPMLYQGKDYFHSLGYKACPTSILLDKKGKVYKIFQGFDKEAIEKVIELALGSN